MGSVRVSGRQLPARYVPLFSAALPAVRRCNHHVDEADSSAGALLRYVVPGSFEASSRMLCRSDGDGQVVEGDAEPMAIWDVGGDVVVAAAKVLHERVPGGEDPR